MTPNTVFTHELLAVLSFIIAIFVAMRKKLIAWGRAVFSILICSFSLLSKTGSAQELPKLIQRGLDNHSNTPGYAIRSCHHEIELVKKSQGGGGEAGSWCAVAGQITAQ